MTREEAVRRALAVGRSGITVREALRRMGHDTATIRREHESATTTTKEADRMENPEQKEALDALNDALTEAVEAGADGTAIRRVVDATLDALLDEPRPARGVVSPDAELRGGS